ncbi:MAG: hypothetical protein KDB27_12810 [Planctomycetales bacterium]|nr:hypothetical protein [Planctomycetales bacterium]
MIAGQATNRLRQNWSTRRQGFTSIDFVAATVIFVGVILLTTQLLFGVSANSKLQRKRFRATQTAANLAEVVSAVPFSELDQLQSPQPDEQIAALLRSCSGDELSLSQKLTVHSESDGSKRVDIEVAYGKPDRSVKLSVWRFDRQETSDGK